jgi:hypothetical protein
MKSCYRRNLGPMAACLCSHGAFSSRPQAIGSLEKELAAVRLTEDGFGQ